MAKRLKGTDILDLQDSINQADALIKLYKDMDTELSKMASKSKATVAGVDINKVADLKKFSEAQKEINQSLTARDKLENRLKNTMTIKGDLEAQMKVQLAEQNKLNKEAARIKLGLVGAYEKESRLLNDLRKKYKDLAVQNKENTKEGREMLRQITEMDTKLKKVDATVGQHQRNVGNYTSALDRLKTGLGGVVRLAGQLGIVMGGAAVFRSSLNIIRDFEQAQVDLQSISGKTAQELETLTAQAKALGESTAFSASEVTNLQIELAKLGFTQQQIEESTSGILAFAAATGADLPRSAALAGSALRAFNLDASEMDRVVSVLGVATTKTALDVSRLETGLSTIAPVAAAFGFSIEDTTALLGQLANAGFDASSSATATRNILLNLADANGDLAKQLGRPVKNAEDLAAGLKELQARGIDLGEALELTDKRSVAAFATFLQGADTLVDLRDSITDVSGELKDMEEKRLNSVNGQLKILNSAWEGFLLNLNETSGASNMLKNAISFLARNLNTILLVVGQLVKAFVVYKSTMIAINLVEKARHALILLNTRGLLGLFGAQTKSTVATKSATVAQKGFNTAVKAFPIGLLVTALISAITYFADFRSEAEKAAEASDLIAEAARKAREAMRGQIGDTLGRQDNFKNKLQEEIDLLAKKGATEEEIFEAQKKAAKEMNEIREASISSLEDAQDEATLRIRRRESELEEARGRVNKESEFDLIQGALVPGAHALHIKRLNEARDAVTELEAAMASDKAIREELVQTEKALGGAYTAEDFALKSLNEVKKKKAKADEKELSHLANLKKQLKDVNDQREKGIKDGTGDIEQLTHRAVLLQNEIDLIEKKLKLDNESLAVERKKVKQIDTKKKETENNVQAISAAINEGLEEERIEREKQQKEMAEAMQGITEISNFYADQRLMKMDEEIRKQDELVEAARRRQDEFRELAQKGQADAKENLAFEQKAEEEALKKKEALEKKKRRQQLGVSALNAYNSRVQAGDANPLASTISDITALMSFVQTLPTFYEGTTTTVSDSLGKPHLNTSKDGYIVRVDGDEKILNPFDSERTGSMTTNEIADVAEMYRKGMLIERGGEYSTASNYRPVVFSSLERKIEQQNRYISEMNNRLSEIASKPSQVIQTDLVGDVLRVVETQQSRGRTVNNIKRHRLG